jgi:hypothetical protein
MALIETAWRIMRIVAFEITDTQVKITIEYSDDFTAILQIFIEKQ